MDASGLERPARLKRRVVIDQSDHSAPIHPVKCVHDVVPIEYCQQALHGSRRVARSRLNVLPEDAPGVLYGAHERILVGIIDNEIKVRAHDRPRHWETVPREEAEAVLSGLPMRKVHPFQIYPIRKNVQASHDPLFT